ncbi:MAG: aminopeptidase P family protein [Candidatus Asgardarchaeum californiense]|nr:MAG: aminopeptidase P family protein [Candidatus Asgardarchaeum californiense]
MSSRNKILKVQKLLKEKKLDFWLIVTSELKDIHSPWILGTKCHTRHAVVIPSDGSPSVMIAEMEAPMVKKAKIFKENEVYTYESPDDFINFLKEKLTEKGDSPRIAINYVDDLYKGGEETINYLLHGDFLELTKIVPKANFVSAQEILYTLRAVKDDDEIKLHKKAAEITIKAVKHAIEHIKPGVTEAEIAAEADYIMKKYGAEPGFDTIVAAGPNSADPHHNTSNYRIEKESLIIIDLGAKYKFHTADMTWTVYLGDNPSEKIKHMYSVVKEAHDKAIEAVRPGIEAWEIDKTARDYIYANGYSAKEFMHSTGHPIGIHVHDVGPAFTEKEKSKRALIKLEPGMIMTVEPGVYIQKIGGVRIEDDVLVTKDGHEVLTKTPEELIKL